MKYLALLRGINVGEKSKVPVPVLKKVFEDFGFTKVITYINSGNVIFESKESLASKLREIIESELYKTFKMDLRIVSISKK